MKNQLVIACALLWSGCSGPSADPGTTYQPPAGSVGAPDPGAPDVPVAPANNDLRNKLDLQAPPPFQPPATCATCGTTTLGGPCVLDSDCDTYEGSADGICYVGDYGTSVFPSQGYCTRDNGGTLCTSDTDCGPLGQCADSDGYKFCVLACSSDGCPSDSACLGEFDGYPLDRPACVPGSATAHDGDACAGFYQCGAYSVCDSSIEDPNGRCTTYDCTIGDDSTCNGGTCIAVDEYPEVGNLCVATCASDADCRVDDGYVCYDAGDGTPSYCRHPHIGDTCMADTDCAAGWSCDHDIDQLTAGYCTLACPTPGTEAGCSWGSLCETVAGVNQCVDRCALFDAACADPADVCTDVGVPNGGACMPVTPPG